MMEKPISMKKLRSVCVCTSYCSKYCKCGTSFGSFKMYAVLQQYMLAGHSAYKCP